MLSDWSKEIIKLIEKGLTTEEIVKRVPFRSEYVASVRKSLVEKGV